METSIKIFSKREDLISLLKGKIIIVDEAVYKLHPFLEAFKDDLYIICDPESSKTMTGCQELLDYLLARKTSKDAHLIAIGGGALSDLVGFTASIYKRGVSWLAVPTTILSLIDASIGGKTALNSKFGKNTMGSFHPPEIIYIDYEFLKTLPKLEIDSGHGELLKYAFLTEEVADALKENDFQKAYLQAAKYKQEIVKKDPFEKNERKLLNLGHTIGHAIEGQTKLPHGICVLVGLKIILNLYKKELLPTFLEFQKKLKITEPILELDVDKIIDFIGQDKKIEGSEIDLIIPRSLGESEIKKINLNLFKEKVVCELKRN